MQNGGLWLGIGLYVGMAVGSIALAVAVIVRWPPDHFARVHPLEEARSKQHPVARTLVLIGKNVLGGLSTVLLSNIGGGSGATAGTIAINGTNIDLSAASTLADVVAGINAAGIAGVSAAVNNAKSGIVITKATAGALDIADISGDLATKLGIAVAASPEKVSAEQ